MFPQDGVALTPGFDQKIYTVPSPVNGSAGSWFTWEKPLGKSFAYMICIGGGAGGASGTNSSTNGGSGGGSGGIARLAIPLILLPDILFIQVGIGGASDTNGGRSYIGSNPSSANERLYLRSGQTLAQTGSGGTGGAGETIALLSGCTLASNGTFQAVAGVAGVSRGANAAGLDIAALASIVLTGGAGGGGGANPGGSVTAAGQFAALAGGAGGASPGAGGNGYMLQGGTNAFAAIGGAGGGGTATAATTGGRGGNGGMGCGGGGGGGSSSSTAGAGGKGGDGMVAIFCV